MSVPIDQEMVRQFLEIISAHALKVTDGNGPAGVLQLCRLSPLDDKILPSRFAIGDVIHMVQAALCDAESCNVYIEGRTVRAGLKAGSRGALADTAHVFALVVDCDGDKGKGGNVTLRPSLVVETSPGNQHLWFLLTRAIPAAHAKLIGDAIRLNSGADQDTGVPTQCYRVARTPNYPNARKRARGRITVEPTRIVEWTGRLWDPDELSAAFPALAAPAGNGAGIDADEASVQADLLADIQNGGSGHGNDRSRSALFHSVIWQLKRRNWSREAIVALFEKYPNGIGAKYGRRLGKEIERSWSKANGGLAPPPPPPGGATGSAAGSAAPRPTPHVLPTIQLGSGQLPRSVRETEQALLAAGAEAFARAGVLVYPVSETVTASDGRKTTVAKLRTFTTDSFTEPTAECAIFQRYNVRQKKWLDADPPVQLVRMLLSRDKRWAFPRVSGIITTPTLRPDGSLLSTPGYDPRSELYLVPGLQLPPVPERPTRDQAAASLATLKELFFKQQDPPIDRAAALSGLLTALLRGSLPTAPIHLIRADTPGTGKSYLVDIIAMVATGRLCPVITASKSPDELEKRIGAVLLSGSSIVSLDNIERDLEGELLCQLSERPIIRIRVLGYSEMPDCECHTAVFATGNNVGFRSDMVRRGLLCTLEALDERPELRAFQHDAWHWRTPIVRVTSPPP
ncbi:MAG TPA: DNA-primase RepB domain-containing protein [Xanthobacteraceae bacterium]